MSALTEELTIPSDHAELVDFTAELATRLKTHLQQSHGLTLESEAPRIGMSASSLSRFISGSEAHRTGKAASKIATYLRLERERANTTMVAGFVETTVSRKIYALCSKCHKLSTAGLIEGPSGIGKTQGVLRFQAVVNNGLIHWVRSAPNCTPKMLLARLGKSIGTTAHRGRAELADAIMDKLTPNHMIIIDQAHEMRPACVDELMQLIDETGCSLILIGTHETWDVLHGAGNGMYEQMLDRISVHLKLAPNKTDDGPEWFPLEEVAGIVRNVSEDLPDAAVRWLYELANKRGSLRLATKVLELALEAGIPPAKISASELTAFSKITPGTRR